MDRNEKHLDIVRHNRSLKLKDAESLSLYKEGGFHPVHIGDLYARRYKVLHKLGHGVHSTAWLVHDQWLRRNSCLKICSALHFENGKTECDILNYVQSSQFYHAGRQHVNELLNYFTITGPKGTHICIVTKLGAPLCIHRGSARQYAYQLSLAVEFLHSCGVCHGDISRSNILHKVKCISRWTEDQIYEKFGRPRQEPVQAQEKLGPRDRSIPKYLVHRINFANLNRDDYYDHILLTDFGSAFTPRLNEPIGQSKVFLPPLLCPPECMFTGQPSFAMDIWALGCMIFTIRAKRPLFDPHHHFVDEDIAMCQISLLLGKLPDYIWGQWENRHTYFRSNGRAHKTCLLNGRGSLEQRVNSICADEKKCPGEKTAELISRSEAESLCSLLRSMLSYEPDRRLTAEEVTRQRWFHDDLRQPRGRRVMKCIRASVENRVHRAQNQVLRTFGRTPRQLVVTWL